MRDSDKIAIQEMGRIMCKPPSPFATDTAEDILNGCYLAVRFAERLYLAGYRKQSEGEWVKDNASQFKHRYNCSVCDYRFLGIPTPYCPNCGARMKGGAE